MLMIITEKYPTLVIKSLSSLQEPVCIQALKVVGNVSSEVLSENSGLAFRIIDYAFCFSWRCYIPRNSINAVLTDVLSIWTMQFLEKTECHFESYIFDR
jgi:hypothetical protein